MPPDTKARVVLQHLKTQKLENGLEGSTPKTPEKRNPETKNQTSEEDKLTKGETRTVPDIRVEASDIEKKVLAFCLDPSKKVNEEQSVTIVRYFKDMRGIVEELLLHNSYLAGG
jgi:hypothetical protein